MILLLVRLYVELRAYLFVTKQVNKYLTVSTLMLSICFFNMTGNHNLIILNRLYYQQKNQTLSRKM